MEKQSFSQTTGPANRTVSVMTRLEGGRDKDNTGKIVRPVRTKKQGCAPKFCKSHGQQNDGASNYPVHPSSATSLQQTNISCPPSRQLSFQEPRRTMPQRSAYQQYQRPLAKASSSPYANMERYIPCPQKPQQQVQQQSPVVCICSSGQQYQKPVPQSNFRQYRQGQQQVVPSYPVPPYATSDNTDFYAGKNKSVTFCSANASLYNHKFLSPCHCGQYHEFQTSLLVPRPYRQASAIFQRVPASTPGNYRQNETPVQICYSPGTRGAFMNDPNYLIREQPTRDNDIEGACMCSVPGSRPISQTRMPSRKNSSSFKVSPMGYAAQMDDCGCMEAVEQPDTICLPCGHTFPEGPKDTCWRVKIMKDVGTMTKGLEFGIQTQTNETRIIDADKLEELLPPEERFDDLASLSKLDGCAPCLEAAQGLAEGCCSPCSVRISDDIQYSNGSLMRSHSGLHGSPIGSRTSQGSQGKRPGVPDDCCSQCPEYEKHLESRKKACVIM